MPTAQVWTIKWKWSLGGFNVKFHCRCHEHLVAISLQSIPSTPGQGHSRTDTDPEGGGKKKINILQLTRENMRIFTETFLPHQTHRFIHVDTVLPEIPPCWVCSCAEFWQRRRCPPCSGTGSSPGGCYRHRRSHCDRRRYCRENKWSQQVHIYIRPMIAHQFI